jgi:hypothetical protein
MTKVVCQTVNWEFTPYSVKQASKEYSVMLV